MPSSQPSTAPVTEIPSGSPTNTGPITLIELAGTTTKAFSDADKDAFQRNLADLYSVQTDDVEMAFTYEASGTMDITIPTDMSPEEAAALIEAALSEQLSVHVRDIDVTVNPDGSVSYTISSEDFAEAEAAQAKLQDGSFQSDLDASLETIDVDAIDVNDDIVVNTESNFFQ